MKYKTILKHLNKAFKKHWGEICKEFKYLFSNKKFLMWSLIVGILSIITYNYPAEVFIFLITSCLLISIMCFMFGVFICVPIMFTIYVFISMYVDICKTKVYKQIPYIINSLIAISSIGIGVGLSYYVINIVKWYWNTFGLSNLVMNIFLI